VPEAPQVDLLAWTVDGAPISSCGEDDARNTELEEILRIKRKLWLGIHPSATYPGQVALSAADRTQPAYLAAVLRSLATTGHMHVSLVDRTHQRETRYLTNPIRTQQSSAQVELVADGTPGAVRVESYQDYSALLEAVLRRRRAGERVQIAVDGWSGH
jgi:hypothetical protein